MMTVQYEERLSFYNQLRFYYNDNKGKIRRNYRDLTKKFLDYNDVTINPQAYLRKPQFEALEMYVFVKEFLTNKQIYQIFDDWRKKNDNFADASYYTFNNGQINALDAMTEKQSKALFKQMEKYAESYPNYIFALTMGLGKTILMATCIFYEFLLANKWPKDDRYCHNALVFAPDKTVLQSLKEIVTFDKTLVVPPEYARVLDANIKIHYLEEAGKTLNTLDDSDFNLIISNTQKIIVKKKHKVETSTERLFKSSSLLAAAYGEEEESEELTIDDDKDLLMNQRFMKLCRLKQIGVYVDEAHHMFGSELEKSLHDKKAQTSLRYTINLLAEDLERHGAKVVACYNYTGTPYVKNQLLPEVIYAYGLKESILNGYLKDADIKGFENVKNEDFLRAAITEFWEKYSGKTYEGLNPKLAIFASRIDEVENIVKPLVETILAELGIATSKILVNTGDTSQTKPDDLRNFNRLDVVGSEGNEKQFIILVEKGREGWNCRSLFGVALFRSPSSKIFVLQSTMRCLRQISDEQQTASVFLSKENYETLNDELHQNFNMDIKDLKDSNKKDKLKYQVRVLPPPRYLTLKKIKHNYELIEKEYKTPLDFDLVNLDLTKYETIIYEKNGLTRDLTVKMINGDKYRRTVSYSAFTLTGEVARFLNRSCILISRILNESVDGIETILEFVNRYNEIIDDIIVPKIFKTLFEVKCSTVTEDKEVILLREPKDGGYYEFSAEPNLVVRNTEPSLKNYASKSFHADTYCFDSKPEKECFLQYITSDKISEVFFTGMFTSNQGDLSIQYYDPESQRIRYYYPDFIAKLNDGTYQIIEVKGDNMLDDIIVKAKSEAAEELATASSIKYIMYASSDLMNSSVL